MSKKNLLVLVAVAIAVMTVAPVSAFAGGDQVNRPDESGTAELQSEGTLPEWAPRAQQSVQP